MKEAKTLWVDSHLHLADEKMAPHFEEYVQRAEEASVQKMVVICTCPSDVERALKMQERYPDRIYLVGSTTPHEAATRGEEDFPFFAQMAEEGRFVALGESGLDYYYEHSPKEEQKRWLREYLRLAHKLSLPIVIHCREAFGDLFTILDEEERVPGVLHCFTGNYEEALEVVKRGWYVSFSGIVTFKKSVELQEVARAVPLENLFIETDAPYLAPQSKRGKPNEPSFLPEVGQMVAHLKNLSVEEVAYATSKNICKLFSLPD